MVPLFCILLYSICNHQKCFISWKVIVECFMWNNCLRAKTKLSRSFRTLAWKLIPPVRPMAVGGVTDLSEQRTIKTPRVVFSVVAWGFLLEITFANCSFIYIWRILSIKGRRWTDIFSCLWDTVEQTTPSPKGRQGSPCARVHRSG